MKQSTQKHAGVHSKGTLTLQDVIESVKKRPDFGKVGAMALFVGVVRGKTKQGESVRSLRLEAYEEKADETLEKICMDLRERKKDIIDVQIHHFTGEFEIGEDLIYVVVAGGHRESVFPALREAVERYKSEAPIFKKETIGDKKGKAKAYWVSEHKAG